MVNGPEQPVQNPNERVLSNNLCENFLHGAMGKNLHGLKGKVRIESRREVYMINTLD